MSNDNIYHHHRPGAGKIFVGLLLLLVGGALLLQQFTFFAIPWWIWRWPMWLILIGLYSGAKHNFKNSGWIIMILVGCVFLTDDIFPEIDLHRLIWPIILIAIGAWIITGRNAHWKCVDKKAWRLNNPKPWEANYAVPDPNNPNPVDPVNPQGEPYTYNYTSGHDKYGDDYINATSVFGSVNKTILSKDFKGGDITNVFGGAELNFTQADISGKVYIDVTQLFGGIKLIVPPHWQVVSDMAAIFAGIDDKRRPGTVALHPDKILVLRGTSIFAGIEIKSF